MEVCTIGGFEGVGKNMTAVKIKDDVFIFDIGLDIPGIVELQEEHLASYADRNKKGGPRKHGSPYSEEKLRRFGAVPDDLVLDKIGWKDKVRAIFIGHAHLDHVGAAPYLAKRYPNAPIYGTPFTMEVLKTLAQDEGVKINNPIKVVRPNSKHMIKGKSEKYTAEFVHATHSTVECVYPVLHTSEGIFFYALDLKFDNRPTLGNPPNYKRLEELGNKNIKVLIIDALYSGTEKKPGSETIAKHLIEDALAKVSNSKKAIFVTTFSSHIERLNSIVEFGKKTGREIIFLGRSLYKYVNAAIAVNKCPFKKDIQFAKYGSQVNSILRKVEKNRDKYLIVCTGHQAEENSILDRIVRGDTPFNFKKGDNLIFASSIIPVPINISARARLDSKLKRKGVRIQIDVHVHGHGSREDMRDMLRYLKPKNVICAHGTLQQEAPFIELAEEFGYKFGETSHLVNDGKVLKF